MKTHRWLLVALALVALSWLPACASSEDGPAGGLPDFGTMSAALESFQSCGELEDYLRQVVLDELDAQVGYYQECLNDPEGCWGYGIDVAVGGGGAEWMADGEGQPAPSANEGGAPRDSSESYSETNTQEAGVDEADIVKSDGVHLYVLQGGQLHVLLAAPADEMTVLGSVAVDGTPIEMFLSDDASRVAVFSRQYRYGYDYPGYYGGGARPSDTEPEPDMTPPSAGGDDEGGAPEEYYDEEPREERPEDVTPASPLEEALAEFQGEILQVSVFDVRDPSAPSLVAATWFEAGYISSRMVGDRVHLVVQAYPRIPSFQWYGYYDYAYPSEPGEGGGSGEVPAVDAGSAVDPDEPTYEERQEPLEPYEMSLEEAAAHYRQQIAETSLEDVMPRRLDLVDGAPQVDFLVPCANFFHPSEVMGLNVLSVLSFDLGASAPAVGATGILGSSNTVYASADTLYAATFVYDYWRWARVAASDPGSAIQRTAIHAFDIRAEQGPAPYLASGIVEGDILNQFSMSEYEGSLRVATTTQTWDQEDWSRITNNAVSVLQRFGDELRVVGNVDGLGEPGEQIFAARFLGDKGYVVTFEQQDPLVTLDLSDPTNPQVRGELHIPGFSSYIHPLGDSHLLTIGRDSSTGPDGWNDAVKLAIYDVSDLTNPREIVTPLLLAGANSAAEYDHKAFNYFVPEGFTNGLLAIPISSYWWDGDGSQPENGLSLFEVDPVAGFTALGTISHQDLVAYDDGRDDMYCGWYLPAVQRSVFIGPRVYSISDMGVKVNALDETLSELNAAVFPGAADPYYGYYGDCYYGGMAEGGMAD